MGYLDAMFVQPSRPFLGAASRGEHDFDFLLGDDLHQFSGLRTHQRHVHAEWVSCGLTALDDMFPQHFGRHRAGTNQSKSTRVAHGGGEFPSAAPHHATGDNGIVYVKKFCDSRSHCHGEYLLSS